MAREAIQVQPEWQLTTTGATLDDPLTDCLVALSRMFDRPVSSNALRAGLPLVEDRLTPELFERAAARAGLSARLVKRRLPRISPMLMPAVLLLQNEQACVLLEVDREAKIARVLLPETGTGEHEIELEELHQRYIGHAIFVRPEHQLDERAPEVLDVQSRNWFWGALFRNWRIYRDVLVASLLVNLFALAFPFFVLNVYDRVVPNSAIETLWVLAIGVAIVAGFDLLIRALRAYFIDRAGRRVDMELSARLLEKVLGLKSSSRPASVGGFANNLHEFEGIRDFITSTTITTVIDVPFVAVFLAVIWFIGGSIVWIPVAGMSLILLYGLGVQWPLRKAVENTFRASSQKNATLVESLAGAETIKALCAEGQIQRTWEQAVSFIAKWGARARLLSASATHFAMFMQHLTTIGLVVYGVHMVAAGGLSLGGLIAVVILGRRSISPMAQLANLATRYHQARAALRTLNRVMDLPVERSGEQSFVQRPVISGKVELQNASFVYPGQETEALRNVSFCIEPGEHVAIIGRMGSGKTTLSKLLLNLYEPSSGAVRIGGTDVRQLDPVDLRRAIGYVPQDVVLFYGTLRDNILMGAPYADDADILRATSISGVSEFVDRHPRGFDMAIGERGAGLSGGQRQSVSLARALLLDPPLVILDEPTNSMDNRTETHLKSRLTDFLKGKTLVLVTHRSSMLELVDRVIILDNGTVVADGPKENILEALNEGKIHGVGS